MKLIFITRKLDRADTRTGFVFDWIESLAGKLDHLYVVCQEKGELGELSHNVEVHSFRKDRRYGRLRQLFDFLFLLFKFSKNSQGIFAHMMPVYAIVAWLPAKLTGKKLILWYTHKSVDWKLKLAAAAADRVLTASKESFRLKTPKVRVVGHGILVGKFKNQKSEFKNTNQKSKFGILSIGRISRVKDYESLIKAMEILVNRKQVKDVHCDIYGDPAVKADLAYLQSLQEFVRNADLQDFVNFRGGVPYSDVPALYRQADLFVNLSQTGSLDKTVLEAAASRTLVLTSNEAFAGPLSKLSDQLLFERDNPQMLSKKILELKMMDSEKRNRLEGQLMEWVEKEHGVAKLTDRIIEQFR